MTKIDQSSNNNIFTDARRLRKQYINLISLLVYSVNWYMHIYSRSIPFTELGLSMSIPHFYLCHFARLWIFRHVPEESSEKKKKLSWWDDVIIQRKVLRKRKKLSWWDDVMFHRIVLRKEISFGGMMTSCLTSEC